MDENQDPNANVETPGTVGEGDQPATSPEPEVPAEDAPAEETPAA